ncbi:hypothetical protein [Natronorubrum sp. A-ect3]|uniref:hypothetical protein n=1 Tax=Natronorubrum sp. A-ect3 TaxID=3242698 RepID=UPI00359EAC45
MREKSDSSRRRYLLGSGILCSTILSGCVDGIITNDEIFSLSKIDIYNYTGEDQIILVAIEDGNEQVYADTEQVPSSDGDSPGIRGVENIPESPGVYNTYFDLERNRDDNAEFWVEYENVNKNEAEYVVDIVSDPDGNPILELSQDSVF